MFACPECEIPFAGGHCECRREWTETGGVPDLYVAAQERGELPGISTALRGFYEESPGAPWRQEDDARALAWTWDADPLIGRLHADLSPRARVLDLGCGSGGAACFLGLLGREVIGVDLAMTGLLRAEAFRRKLGLDSVSFVRGNLFRPPAAPGSADAVVMIEVLECTAAPAAALRAAALALRPGGLLALRVATPFGVPPQSPHHDPPMPSSVHRWVHNAGFRVHSPHSGRLVQEVSELRWKWLGGGPATVSVMARKR